ncbi:hypothetical protein MUP77_21685 [Candidatus Bathyarchaeota archaeon]|nr:hypothetical protein [Candidatus Bathyarchaeota archaeon]
MEPTPRIQCYGKAEAKKLEEILFRIKTGTIIKKVTQLGAIVYIDLKD